MHRIVCVLLCLAGAGHGRRLQTSDEQSRGHPVAEDRRALSALLASLDAKAAFNPRLPLRMMRPATTSAVKPPQGLPRRFTEESASSLHVHSRAPAPTMSLFGLGAPEIAVILIIALFVLGPENVNKLAKDFGKISAELKQVPEEFNAGIEAGAEERKAEKTAAPAPAPAPALPPATPAPAAEASPAPAAEKKSEMQ
mmetsp:Transcript_26079/g.45396  ORF Transcript_26079/g.45396 Transcript_26079/m.45396 type:complete len:197 (-) Transcript_26079:41-631(-)